MGVGKMTNVSDQKVRFAVPASDWSIPALYCRTGTRKKKEADAVCVTREAMIHSPSLTLMYAWV